jgi:leucyl-tRNA synthetase
VKESGAVRAESWEESIKALLLLLAPSCPHITEELWQRRGYEYSIHNRSWPKWDESLAKDEEITLVVQVNGKVRDRVSVLASIAEDEAKKLAVESPKVKAHLESKKILNIIYVPGRLVNIVVR